MKRDEGICIKILKMVMINQQVTLMMMMTDNIFAVLAICKALL